MFVLVYYIIILYFSLFLSSKGMGNAGYAVIAVGSILLFLGYYIQEQVYLNILNEKCDPIRFLKLMNKKIENYKWIKSLRIPYEFNCAVSYMSLGRYREAKSCIQECGISGLNLNRRYSITYIINLIICHYQLDELEQAAKRFSEIAEKGNTLWIAHEAKRLIR